VVDEAVLRHNILDVGMEVVEVVPCEIVQRMTYSRPVLAEYTEYWRHSGPDLLLQARFITCQN
jgi:hypothetical protein